VKKWSVMEASAAPRELCAAVSGSGRFHAQAVLVPAPETPAEPAHDPIARAGEAHCACCGRSPLVGELAILHVGEKGESWSCELCERSARRIAHLGEARARVRVRPGRTGAELYQVA
jgi:hypothetical protein